ncbi:MAG: hypothetical protein IJ842_00680 [Bacilli bacterium]|nr:hypothetical protein [Bacilli bacterium]
MQVMQDGNVKLSPAEAMETAQKIKANADKLTDAMNKMVDTIKKAQENGAVTEAHIKMLNEIEDLRANGLEEAIGTVKQQADNIEAANRKIVEYSQMGAK